MRRRSTAAHGHRLPPPVLTDKNHDRRRRFGLRVLVLRGPDGRPFLTRFRLHDGERFGVYLHHITGPDPGIDLHDHPWRFTTFVLRGGYIEERAHAREASLLAELAEQFPATCAHGVEHLWRAGSVHTVRPDQAHRIIWHRQHTWTLVVVGRKFREWGFFMPAGWQSFRNYDYTARRPGSWDGA